MLLDGLTLADGDTLADGELDGDVEALGDVDADGLTLGLSELDPPPYVHDRRTSSTSSGGGRLALGELLGDVEADGDDEGDDDGEVDAEGLTDGDPVVDSTRATNTPAASPLTANVGLLVSPVDVLMRNSARTSTAAALLRLRV